MEYKNIKQLKKLYKTLYSLESHQYNGNSDALVIHTDLIEALNPLKRIITLKQRFCISEVLINNKTQYEIATILGCNEEEVNNHINIGLKRILNAINNGTLYNNNYQYIAENYDKMTVRQIAFNLDMNDNTVKTIIRRMKKGGYLGDDNNGV